MKGRSVSLCCCLLWAAAGGFAAEMAPVRPWSEYRTILWTGDSAYKKPEKLPLFFQRMREMGINTAMVDNDGDPGPATAAGFPYYVENMVNKGLCLKWNSNVRDWDKFVSTWAKSGRPLRALVRDYCLDDPAWNNWAQGEMRRLVRKNMANTPVAYNIRDELSTTFSANPFDYDFNPITLKTFRDWLKGEYRDLGSLNAEWETRFASWDEVTPFTTDEIKNRMAGGGAMPAGRPDWQGLEQLRFDPAVARKTPGRWNFSPWCDFRTFMDVSLAGALEGIRQAAHKADPRTPVGIEGTQAPSAFGGYDLWRLSGVLDWVEAYDVGNAREIFGSFMPGKPVLTTVFENDANHARRRLWHLLLEGDRGCIVWWSEDCIDWKSSDYALTPKAHALAPVLGEMTSPLARLFLRAEPVRDPVAIHYSQASIQADWLIESTVDGSTWLRRFSSYEADHNRMVRVRDGWLKALEDVGYSPEFVSSEEIERGDLARFHALVLPESFSISNEEARRIGQFSGLGGGVFCDGAAGCFDEHGKLRTEPLWRVPASTEGSCFLRSVAAPGDFHEGDIAAYPGSRLSGKPDFDLPGWIATRLAGMPPEVAVPVESCTRVHRYKLGEARLVAFERNFDNRSGEDLKAAGGNENLEAPVEFEAKLGAPAHVYDLRTQRYLGHTDRIAVTLDPWQPSLFALLKDKVPAEKLLQVLSAEDGSK